MEQLTVAFDSCPHARGNVVLVSGEIDVATAPQLGEAIAKFRHGDVVVEFASVDFIDAAGLKVLVRAHRRLASRGSRLVLRGVSGMTMRVMQITGLDEVFDFDGDGIAHAQNAS